MLSVNLLDAPFPSPSLCPPANRPLINVKEGLRELLACLASAREKAGEIVVKC